MSSTTGGRKPAAGEVKWQARTIFFPKMEKHRMKGSKPKRMPQVPIAKMQKTGPTLKGPPKVTGAMLKKGK